MSKKRVFGSNNCTTNLFKIGIGLNNGDEIIYISPEEYYFKDDEINITRSDNMDDIFKWLENGMEEILKYDLEEIEDIKDLDLKTKLLEENYDPKEEGDYINKIEALDFINYIKDLKLKVSDIKYISIEEILLDKGDSALKEYNMLLESKDENVLEFKNSFKKTSKNDVQYKQEFEKTKNFFKKIYKDYNINSEEMVEKALKTGKFNSLTEFSVIRDYTTIYDFTDNSVSMNLVQEIVG